MTLPTEAAVSLTRVTPGVSGEVETEETQGRPHRGALRVITRTFDIATGYNEKKRHLAESRRHSATLFFKEGRMESAFRDYYSQTAVERVKAGYFVIMIITALLGVMDDHLFKDDADTVRFWRFTTLVPVMFIFFILSFTRLLQMNQQVFSTIYALVFGGALSATTLLGDKEIQVESTGVTLFIYLILAFNFLWLRFVPAFCTVFVVLLWQVVGVTTLNDYEIKDVANLYFLVGIVFIAECAQAYIWEVALRRDFIQARVLDIERDFLKVEKETSDALLANVLPAPVIERLKSHSGVIADRFPSVTVLFADIVGFTALSTKLSPEQIVAMLNRVFGIFDLMAGKYGLEKVKTIGDCYMLVGGLPVERHDHAEAVCRMALDMMHAIEVFSKDVNTGFPVEIRIGVHTGAAVAGVIGFKKFAYDLWGDTVNTASRMESHGAPMRIHISDDTRQAISHVRDFVFEPRGTIDVKSKGPMTTFFLSARPAFSFGSISFEMTDIEATERSRPSLFGSGRSSGGGGRPRACVLQ